MSVIKEVDLNRRRRDIILCGPVCKPVEIGFSVVVPGAPRTNPLAFFEDYSGEHTTQANQPRRPNSSTFERPRYRNARECETASRFSFGSWLAVGLDVRNSAWQKGNAGARIANCDPHEPRMNLTRGESRDQEGRASVFRASAFAGAVFFGTALPAFTRAALSSWQIEHIPGHFERIHHVRKKYACPACETNGDHPQMETAARPETAIDKGMAGPGLLAYIITSKFAEYTPLYRLEDIFARQGFEISRATQSVWCGDVADLVEPLYQLMAERVRASHVVSTDDTIMPMQSSGKTANARMWVYVGDGDHPYNIFDFTLNRGRDGPKYFLQDYSQVLLADAYGGYNGVVAGNGIIRAGCWGHLRRKIIEAEKTAPEIARQAIEMVRALYAVEKQVAALPAEKKLEMRQAQSVPLLAELREKLLAWKEQLLPRHPMAEAISYALSQWQELNVFAHDGAVSIDNNVSEREMKRVVLNRKKLAFRRQPARWSNRRNPGQLDQYLPPS